MNKYPTTIGAFIDSMLKPDKDASYEWVTSFHKALSTILTLELGEGDKQIHFISQGKDHFTYLNL